MGMKLLAFLLATALLVWISRASLARPRSHGFWRLFVWEAIAALVLLNVENWFVEPLAWNQILAWILLCACCVPAVWGAVVLRRHGKPARERPSDPSLLAFEKTTQLVQSGPYRYIRHPLYSSLLLLTWGVFFKRPSWIGLALGAASTAFLFLTAFADEAECQRFFGPEYDAFRSRTTRFIPFIL